MKYLALLLFLGFTSCTAVTSAITGQPIATETVITKDGTQITVASADIYRAKTSPPETVWGFYDAGRLAKTATEVIESGK